ncbi:hypothetical protein MXB_429 [Myxobolus squamalis]|nr:hypothetical protein MXB_429 [Myxobolus squamalis]
MRGLLIAFEGLDRTGKTSQSLLLRDYIRNILKQRCELIRFPDRETEIGSLISSYLKKKCAQTDDHGYDMDWCMGPEKGLPKPDIIFYLKTSPSTLVNRPGFGDEIYEKTAFQTIVDQKYQILAEKSIQLGHNWIVLVKL